MRAIIKLVMIKISNKCFNLIENLEYIIMNKVKILAKRKLYKK